MVNDNLSDFVTRVRNGYMAGRKEIETPATKSVIAVAEVLVKSGYLEKIERAGSKLSVFLKYEKKKPAIIGIERVSKPGSRFYVKLKDLPRVWGGLGINILSTPKGIVSDKDARKLNQGGELVAKVW